MPPTIARFPLQLLEDFPTRLDSLQLDSTRLAPGTAQRRFKFEFTPRRLLGSGGGDGGVLSIIKERARQLSSGQNVNCYFEPPHRHGLPPCAPASRPGRPNQAGPQPAQICQPLAALMLH